MKKFILWSVGIFIFLMLLGLNSTFDVSQESTNTVNVANNKKVQPVVATELYTTDYEVLKNKIIDTERDLSAVFVQDTISRIIDNDPRIYEYPFYAMKNQKGDGYIGIMVTNLGKAIFLIPSYQTLNETNKSILESQIKAVNGTAKNLNSKIDFATGYNPSEVLEWVK